MAVSVPALIALQRVLISTSRGPNWSGSSKSCHSACRVSVKTICRACSAMLLLAGWPLQLLPGNALEPAPAEVGNAVDGNVRVNRHVKRRRVTRDRSSAVQLDHADRPAIAYLALAGHR